MKYSLRDIVKEYGAFALTSVVLWLLVWAGYDTDLLRSMAPGFPHGALDFIHGVRAYFPIAAGAVALIFLFTQRKAFSKKFFLTPPGLMFVFLFSGIISTIFLSINIVVAGYWALMYGSALVVLLFAMTAKDPLKNLGLIIKANWVIAALISIVLLIFFFVQPGAVGFITKNILICANRPFENLGNIPSTMDMFGAIGSRSTGFSRYAAIISIVAFAYVCYSRGRRRILWAVLTVFFLAILYFAKGRTEILGFISAIFIILWLKYRFKTWLTLPYVAVIGLTLFLVFVNVPCTNPGELISSFTPGFSTASVPTYYEGGLSQASIKGNLLSFSGRATNQWPKTLDLISHSPVIGFGFSADRIFLGLHAHDAWLQAAVQAGLLGGIPFFLAFVLTFFLLWKLLTMPQVDEKEKAFLMGMMGVFVFFMVMSIPESFAYYSANYLFLIPIVFYVYVSYKQNRGSEFPWRLFSPAANPSEKNSKRIIITSGYFNPLHVGHVNLLREAKEKGDMLIVIVNNDEQAKLKGSVAFMPESERLAIIQSIKYVDHAVLSVDQGRSVAESLKKIAKEYDGQLFFAKGGDRNVGNIPEDERRVCSDYHIEIINDVGGGKIQSSSWLIENVVNAFFQIKKTQQPMQQFPTIEVLGNKIAMVQINEVVSKIDEWIAEGSQRSHWIVATGMHGVMEAKKSPAFRMMLASSDLWVADGIPLVWLARANGFPLKKRVAGPDLFHAFLQHSEAKGYKHYFYGDTDETLEALKKKMAVELPHAGTASFSPPFRKLTQEEDDKIVADINAAKPDILWIGLGLPKQEKWIYEHKDRLQVPVIVGVGAAFKFEAGMVARAPSWMGDAGFEWLWRLFQEPKRVWRRVFIDAPQFVWFVTAEFAKRKFTQQKSHGN